MPVERDLPPYQKREGKNEKAPCIEPLYKEQRREHHGIVPIVDPARAAAFVLHEPGLERTEKENAYNVAHGIGAGDQDHDPVVKDPEHVERSDHAVKSDPDQRDQYGRVVVGDDDLGPSGLDVIACELLLAAGALVSGREKRRIISTTNTIQITPSTSGLSSRRCAKSSFLNRQ